MKPGISTPCLDGVPTGMAQALLHEIAEHLGRLASTGREARIDLRSLPLTEADLRELEELLGRGEVSAELEVIGPSSLRETSYPGVWWVRHFGANGQAAAEEIAITPLPDILRSHEDDIRDAAARLRRALQARDAGNPDKETSND